MAVREHPREAPPLMTDYALVGDGRSCALVSSGGSVDWWCPPRFDEPSVFARLLDADAGFFRVAPPVRHARRFSYVPETNVAETVFWTEDARAKLRTFMPHVEAGHEGAPRLVLELEGERGAFDITAEFAPRFGYGTIRPTFRALGSGVAATAEDESLALASSVPFEVQDARAIATFRLEAGQRHAFVLDHGVEAPAVDPLALATREREDALAFWRAWCARSTYEGPYADEVRRSLLALKLLQHSGSGTFVAAASASLPEAVGGSRNWDYRYSWVRDGVFIVMAFETGGHKPEARAFREWLMRTLRRDGPEELRMLYRVDGARDLEERELSSLAGYRRSTPVRVGNAASGQRQLDTFGELMLCFHRSDFLFEGAEAEANWRAVRGLVDWLVAHWREPDSGVWEMRGDEGHYVYSKAMACVAIRHGIDIATRHGFDAPLDEWRAAADAAARWVESEGFHEGRGAFTQTTGRADLDASNLLLGLLGFAKPAARSMRATVDATLGGLVVNGFVHRYLVDDGLEGSEGCFLAASFWLSELLARQGRVERAREVFERALSVAGPAGLLPEEVDALTGEPLGNYPQGLSHLALVGAAYAIGAAERGALNRGGEEGR